MSWTSDRVVEIAAEGGARVLGSGAIVADGRVLTARGLVHERAGLVVRQQGGAWEAATVAWPGSEAIDVAVLAANVRAGRGHPLLLLSGRDIAAGAPWEAHGHVVWVTEGDDASAALKQVGGQARSWKQGDARMALDCTSPLTAGELLPGAAVTLHDQVVGVVVSDVIGSGGASLTATHVGTFLALREFRDALGLSDADDEHQRRLADIEDSVRRRLTERPAVATLLAQELRVMESTLADVLVRRRRAEEIARALHNVYARLRHDDGNTRDRLAVWDLLVLALPCAIDWTHLVVTGIDLAEQRRNEVELPTNLATIAEAILAGVHNRTCFYTRDDQFPVGMTRVTIPTDWATYIQDEDGARLSALMIQKLAETLRIQEDDPSNYGQSVDARLYNERLAARANMQPDLAPHYLVFDASKPDDRGSLSLWAVAVRTLQRDLPSFQLVRLTAKSSNEEFRARDLIKILRDWRFAEQQ